jgi:hypothetical protein
MPMSGSMSDAGTARDCGSPPAGAADRAAWRSDGAADGQRPGVPRATPRGLGRDARHHPRLHPAGQAGAERLHRTLQPDLPHRSARCERLHVACRGPRDHRRLAATLQHRTAPRQPRPGAAAHVLAEAHQHPGVPPSGVYATGKLTGSRPPARDQSAAAQGRVMHRESVTVRRRQEVWNALRHYIYAGPYRCLLHKVPAISDVVCRALRRSTFATLGICPLAHRHRLGSDSS